MVRLLLVLCLALPGLARAGACCIGSTSGFGGRLGPCEYAGMATAMVGRIGFGTWTSTGRFAPIGSDRDVDVGAVLSGMLRLDRRAQMSVTLPARLQVRRIAGTSYVGGGQGDLTVTARFTPFEDLYGAEQPPVPTFQLGLSLPTGFPVEASSNPAQATGTGHLVVQPRVGIQRWFLGGSVALEVDAGVPIPRPWDPVGKAPGVSWGVSNFGSVFLNRTLTLNGSFGVRGLGPALVGGKPVGTPSMEPWLGVGAAVRLGKGRLTVGVSSSVPVPSLGRSDQAEVTLSVGYTLIRRTPLPTPSRVEAPEALPGA